MLRSKLIILLFCGATSMSACSGVPDPGPISSSVGGSSTVPTATATSILVPPILPALLPTGPGSDRDDPAEVCLPEGAMAYLRQLRCSDGTRPNVLGRANVGTRQDPPDSLSPAVWNKMGDPTQVLDNGEVDYHVVDRFTVACGGGQQVVFVDVYHCR